MINNDVLSQLQFLIKTSAPPLLEVSRDQLDLPQLVTGEKVPAHVLAALPNGRFQVLVADKSLDMNLPKNTQAGDTVELVFVTNQPRLTFMLARDLGDVANTAKPQVSLSETARFLGGLLEKAAQPQTQKEASSVVQLAPLLAGAPAKTVDFAQALRGAVTQSGLFYESHQAQWVSGQRPLSDLLSEPQGRLSSAATNSQQAANPQPAIIAPHAQLSTKELPRSEPFARAPNVSEGAPVATGTAPQVEHLARHSDANIQSSGDTQTKPAMSPDQPVHPDAMPIVRQQLEVLDSRQMMWQGQVWPGQTMDWQIEERAARGQSGEIEQAEWQTSLHLVLPQLGEVSARLTLHPLGIRVQLDAADPAAAALMTEQQTALQRGMESSGLQLVEMKVGHGTTG